MKRLPQSKRARMMKRWLARAKGSLKFLLRTPISQDFFAISLEKDMVEGSSSPDLLVKKVLDDPTTGMAIRIVRYPAGTMTESHIHPCSHGLYVLEGILETNKGRFPPNTFVWFPEGDIAKHGASSESDALVLLVSNKPFSLVFV